MRSVLSALFSVLLLVAFTNSVLRDIRTNNCHPGDLRNRVVGARLQKDGKDPYFYKWQPADGVRYYEPSNFDIFKASRMTASPFFHTLLYPLTDIPYKDLTSLWLLLSYMALFVISWIAACFTRNNIERWCVVVLAVALTYTEAWTDLVISKQQYLVIPFMVALFFFSLRKKPGSIWWFAVAGILSAALILIRPNTVVLFLPFLALIMRYKPAAVRAFLISFLLLIGFSSFTQSALWKSYYENISEQVKIHQGLGPATQDNYPYPDYQLWEGWDWNVSNTLFEEFKTYSEHGNFFIIAYNLFHIKLTPLQMTTGAMATIILLAIFFFVLAKEKNSFIPLLLLGSSFYMITDFFSPVYRYQYYTVQWFFLLFLAILIYERRYRYIYLLLLSGLILNLVNSPYIKMEHTLGEYFWLLGFTLLSFFYKTPEIKPCDGKA